MGQKCVFSRWTLEIIPAPASPPAPPFSLFPVFSRLTSSSLWRQWSFGFSAHLIFSFLSAPSIWIPFLVSSCNEPGSPHTSLPRVRMGAEIHLPSKKMTSSFYSTANRMQAHGALPSWKHYVHKIGRQRQEITEKQMCKMTDVCFIWFK